MSKNKHLTFDTGSYTVIDVAINFGAACAASEKLAKWSLEQFEEHADRLTFLVTLADELDKQADWEDAHDWYLVNEEIVSELTLLSDTDDASVAELVRLVLSRDWVRADGGKRQAAQQ